MTKRTRSGYRLSDRNYDWLIKQAIDLEVSGADLLNIIVQSVRRQNPDMVRLVLNRLTQNDITPSSSGTLDA